MMEENKNDSKSVNELLGMKFFIPSYQRGYRWQRVNVLDLLNDLCEFLHNDKASYSLQPLVVYDSKKEDAYHVVDGQSF